MIWLLLVCIIVKWGMHEQSGIYMGYRKENEK